ncbi:unnamed protein product [Effrenium voratum]|uniref:EF-hand domain-containing protein n=1 Tax=Effrenium voratum TaxID=2562239 RepID=A0AA36MJ60_9DINO|nr:unnamed protein product [Effrenium voratum]
MKTVAVLALLVSARCAKVRNSGAAPEVSEQAFRGLDRNRDGAITPDELEAEIFDSADAGVTCQPLRR